jgi:hypothetical protein
MNTEAFELALLPMLPPLPPQARVLPDWQHIMAGRLALLA